MVTILDQARSSSLQAASCGSCADVSIRTPPRHSAAYRYVPRATHARLAPRTHSWATVGPSHIEPSVGAVFTGVSPPPHTDTSLSAAATRSPISDVDPPILPASIDAIVGATYRRARAVQLRRRTREQGCARRADVQYTHLAYREIDAPAGGGVALLGEHHRKGRDRRERVNHALACVLRRAPAHRLVHRGAVRVDITASRDAEPALRGPRAPI